jgi:hypothetical protein
MSNFDHYAAARELVSRLAQAGYADEAMAIQTAMEDGATGTEILMALRFRLAEIIKQVPLVGDSRILASRLLAELDESLD